MAPAVPRGAGHRLPQHCGWGPAPGPALGTAQAPRTASKQGNMRDGCWGPELSHL